MILIAAALSLAVGYALGRTALSRRVRARLAAQDAEIATVRGQLAEHNRPKPVMRLPTIEELRANGPMGRARTVEDIAHATHQAMKARR